MVLVACNELYKTLQTSIDKSRHNERDAGSKTVHLQDGGEQRSRDEGSADGQRDGENLKPVPIKKKGISYV